MEGKGVLAQPAQGTNLPLRDGAEDARRNQGHERTGVKLSHLRPLRDNEILAYERGDYKKMFEQNQPNN